MTGSLIVAGGIAVGQSISTNNINTITLNNKNYNFSESVNKFGSQFNQILGSESITGKTWLNITTSNNGQYILASSGESTSAGSLYVSSNHGETFTNKLSAGKYSYCCISSSGQYQFSIMYNGYIQTSSNYGSTWTTHKYRNSAKLELY